jgi:hypothetical protein
MDVIELPQGHDLILDVGHSGAVTGIGRYDDLVVSGGDDGYVFIRGTDGRSVVPPVHLPSVTCLVVVPGIDIVVVGTEEQTSGIDLETGFESPLAGFGGVVAVAGAPVGEHVMLGCSDGSLRTVSADDDPEVVAQHSAPVHAMASDGRLAAVTHDDGTVLLVDATGAVRWRAELHPHEVHRVAMAADGTVYVGGSGVPSGGGELSGVIVQLDDVGVVQARYLTPGWIDAMTVRGDELVVALSDGNLYAVPRALDVEMDASMHLGRRRSGVTTLATVDGEVWVGSNAGEVGRLDPVLELPSVPSGVFALSLTSDELRAVTTDGARVVVWDLTTGEERLALEIPGVRAVTFAGEDSEDLVLAYLDGRLERRGGAEQGDVLATAGPLDPRPHTLGWVGPFVMAIAGEVGDADGSVLLDADDLEELTATEAALDDVSVMERTGYLFAGRGELAGTDVGVVAGTGMVVKRGGLVTATEDLRGWLRVADASGFVA